MSDDDDEGIGFLNKLGIEPGMQQLALTYGLVALGLLGLGAYWFGEKIRVALGGHSDVAHVVETWDSDAPLGRDVNGDGIEDVIGVYVGTDGVYIGAFNGKDGKILWRHGKLDTWRAMYGGQLQFGVQGDRILVNEKGKGTVLGVSDGKPVATLQLPGAREVCAGPTSDAPLVVQTTFADKPFEVDLVSGTVKPLEGRRPCPRVMTTARHVDPSSLKMPSTALVALRDGNRVVAISHNQGKSVIHSYANNTQEPAWSVPVAIGGPIRVPTNAVDLAGGRVVVGYTGPGRDALHVAALDATTGKEAWRVPIASPGSILTSLSATPARVYVAIGDYLVVLDARDGKGVLDLGVGKG